MILTYRALSRIIFAGLATIFLVGCGGEYLSGQFRTVIAPPAQTVAAQGGRFAGTQSARLLQTAQIKLATESAELKETAKVEAATAAAGVIETAQSGLVTQSAGQVTAAPTKILELKNTTEALIATQAVALQPQVETQAARLVATSESRLATESALRLPQAMTQAAQYLQTAQAGGLQGTLVPPALQTRAADLAGTSQAYLATQAAPLLSPPLSLVQPVSTIIVYTVREGDDLSSITNLFGIPQEKLVYLNQLRFPWLASSPQNLAPGMVLVVKRQPDDAAPVAPSGLAAWSGEPGCDVSQVDWLIPPIACQPTSLDVVSRIDKTVACVSLANPLGYTLTHELLRGWMLTGADTSNSYGWFADRDRGAVIVGPALVVEKSIYTECRKPGKP
jgi:hypothetical protein